MAAPETGSISAGSSNNSVARSAFQVALGGLFGLIAGLVSQVVVASIFGAGAEMDAFLTALVVPVYLEAALLAGLPFVFIPTFVQDTVSEREDDAWALTGTFVWLTGGVLVLVAIAGSVSARGIIELTAPGLSPAKAELAARMLAILMLAAPPTGLGTLTAGVQNARNHFFWPAVAAAIGSLGNVVILLVLYRTVGPLALAWGYLASAALQASVTLVPVLRHGWTRLMPLSDGRVREMARLMAPFVCFGILTSSTSLFERYFASGLPDGDLSYLGYAAKIPRIAVALLGTGIATAVFPAMARAYAQDGEAGLVERAEYAFRLGLAVALPAFAIVSAAAVPLVTVLFERGAFEHTATLAISRIVPIVMVAAVLFHIVGNLISRTYFVTKDTHTVPLVAALTSVLYIFLARVLADSWGYVGLALAQPLYSGLAILVLSLLLIRKVRSFHTGKLLKNILMYGAASLIAFLSARLAPSALALLPALVQLLVAFILASTLYMTMLFRIDRDIAVSILEMTGLQWMVNGAKVALRRILETAPG